MYSFSWRWAPHSSRKRPKWLAREFEDRLFWTSICLWKYRIGVSGLTGLTAAKSGFPHKVYKWSDVTFTSNTSRISGKGNHFRTTLHCSYCINAKYNWSSADRSPRCDDIFTCALSLSVLCQHSAHCPANKLQSFSSPVLILRLKSICLKRCLLQCSYKVFDKQTEWKFQRSGCLGSPLGAVHTTTYCISKNV